MGELFLQIAIFLAGAFISLGGPLLRKEGQVRAARICGVLLCIASLLWCGFVLGAKSTKGRTPPPHEPQPSSPTETVPKVPKRVSSPPPVSIVSAPKPLPDTSSKPKPRMTRENNLFPTPSSAPAREDKTGGTSTKSVPPSRVEPYDPVELENQLDQVNILISTGDYAKAGEILKRIINENPGTDIAKRSEKILENLPSGDTRKEHSQ